MLPFQGGEVGASCGRIAGRMPAYPCAGDYPAGETDEHPTSTGMILTPPLPVFFRPGKGRAYGGDGGLDGYWLLRGPEWYSGEWKKGGFEGLLGY